MNLWVVVVAVVVIRLQEVVQHDVFICVADFPRHFCRFIYVAQHVGRGIRPHFDQSVIVQIFAYIHYGLASQNAVFFLYASPGVAVFYQYPYHIATRGFAEFIFFSYGLFDFIFYLGWFYFPFLQQYYQ